MSRGFGYTRHVFEEVTAYGRETWKEDGKRRTRQHKISKTINPWNKPAGSEIPDTREELRKKCDEEMAAWVAAAPEGHKRTAGYS